MIGWAQPRQVVRIVNWCGHSQEFVLLPDAEGWCRMIPVLGEVREAAGPLSLDGERDPLLRPVHGALGRHAVDRLGDHVGPDVVVVDALHGFARLGRPAARVRVLER
jgi:hypothetical protein